MCPGPRVCWLLVVAQAAVLLPAMAGAAAPAAGGAAAEAAAAAMTLTGSRDTDADLLSAIGAGRSMVLPVVVNTEDKGEVLVTIRPSDVLLRAADLHGLGIHVRGGVRQEIDGGEWVSLASLWPHLRYVIDPETLALQLTVDPDLLVSRTLDLSAGRPAGIEYRHDTSAFLNYSFTSLDLHRLEAFAEAGLSVVGGLLSSTVSRDADGAVVRGLTSLTVDERERLRRWVVGDTFAAAGGLGGAAFIGGVSVSRSFDVDPYFVRYPTLDVTGAVKTPSTADVYVNGSLVRRAELPPGQFDLTNILPPAGSGTAKVVIRNAFGQETVLTNPFYASASLLSRGLTEYSFNLGLERNDIAARSFEYGAPVFLGRYRIGLSDTLTLETRLETGEGMASGGAGIAVAGGWGEVEAAVAGSRSGSLSGGAASLAYRYVTRAFSAGATARLMNPRYANLSIAAGDDRPTLDLNAFGGFRVGGRASLSLQYGNTLYRDSGRRESLNVAANLSVMERGSLYVSGGFSRTSEGTFPEVRAGLILALGGVTGHVGSDWKRGDRITTTAEVQKPLPLGEGAGYRVYATQGQGSGGGGRVQYQGRYGTAEADLDDTGYGASTTVRLAGGIVFLGGDLEATRPVTESYALVRVPGVKGVQVFSRNQPVGRTDENGKLLVPDLLPYYGNQLSIADWDVPMQYQIPVTRRVVAPPFRGGAVVTFPVERIRSVRGLVVLEEKGRQVPPSYGELTVEGAGDALASPLGKNGEFDLENLSTGRHRARVRSSAGACEVELNVPDTDTLVVDLGTVACAAGPETGAR